MTVVGKGRKFRVWCLPRNPQLVEGRPWDCLASILRAPIPDNKCPHIYTSVSTYIPLFLLLSRTLTDMDISSPKNHIIGKI